VIDFGFGLHGQFSVGPGAGLSGAAYSANIPGYGA
ncbi:unnamed protein product, partial [marine sediment metagenome]